MNHIQLTKEKINIQHINNLITDGECGACSFFVGMTRDNLEGKKVLTLEYEAYENMALKEIHKLCDDMRMRFSKVKHIAIYHRLGKVPACETSVVIAASAPHRTDALESVSFAIDQLKARVPIWKKEVYEGNESAAWKQNKECPWPRKSSTYDFFSCRINNLVNVSEKLVQIRVADEDLGRRIRSFVKRKRVEIDLNNKKDYVDVQLNNDQSCILTVLDNSCARTRSTIVKQQKSKCHLKVRRVDNYVGPQLRPDYLREINKFMTKSEGITSRHKKASEYFIIDRLETIENYMGPRVQNQKNLLLRIKNIENRILLLESISSEYKHFFTFVAQDDFPQTSAKKCKKLYDAAELNEIIKDLAKDYQK